MHRFRDLAIFLYIMHLKNYIAISTMIRAPQPPNDADIGMVRTAMLAATARSPSGSTMFSIRFNLD